MIDHFGGRSGRPGNGWRARGHRLDHHQSEGLGPVDREQHGAGVAEELGFVRIADLADEFDQRMVEQRLDLLLEIILVGMIDLRGHLQFHPRLDRNLDRPVGAFFGADPAKESKIIAAFRTKRDQLLRQPMIDRPGEIGFRHRAPLVVRNADQPHFGKFGKAGQEVGQVEPPVERRQAFVREMLEQREMHEIDVKMDEVVGVGIGQHPVDHRHRIGQVIVDSVEPQATRGAGNQLGRGFAVAAGV